jgi:nucleotide-binding universal stress UspA family protein
MHPASRLYALITSSIVPTLTVAAAKEPVDASQDADLVVVGARSGSEFARLLLGSVSSEVVQQSACPAVIVPHKR